MWECNNFSAKVFLNEKQKAIPRIKQYKIFLIKLFSYTRFFYKQRFFQLSLSVGYLFHELSLKCCLSVAIMVLLNTF